MSFDFDLYNIIFKIGSLVLLFIISVIGGKLFNICEYGYYLYNEDEIKSFLGKLNEVMYVDGLVRSLEFYVYL